MPVPSEKSLETLEELPGDGELVRAMKRRQRRKSAHIEGASESLTWDEDEQYDQKEGLLGAEKVFAIHDLRLPRDEVEFVAMNGVIPSVMKAISDGVPLGQVLTGFWLDALALGMEVERHRAE